MKRSGLAVLLALVGLLSACTAIQAEGDRRPETGELSLTGTEERMPVQLWHGDGFSVYLPAEGWAQDEMEIWRSEEQPEAAFFVNTYEETEEQALWQSLAQAYAGYGFLPPEDGVCIGYDAVNAMTMWVKLVEAGDLCYAVCAQYPTDSAEDCGAQLRLLADTFETETED